MKILIIGAGYWGRKIIDVLQGIKKVKYIYVYDPYEQVKFGEKIIQIKKLKNLINIKFVFIAVPLKYHLYYLKKLKKLNVPFFVEKPLLNKGEIKNNIKLFNSLNIFTGYVYLYNKFIKKIKKIITKEKSSPLLISFERKNLGPVRNDTSVLYDLASHDLSILNYLFSIKKINYLKVLKNKFFKFSKNCDIFHILMKINKKTLINIHVTWFNAIKERKITIFFKNKIIHYDETTNIITEKKITKNFYKKEIYNIDHIKINEKIFLIKNNNPLKEEILTFLKKKNNDFKKNKKISFKTQKMLDIISSKK
jgi:predicted dehydrogenase